MNNPVWGIPIDFTPTNISKAFKLKKCRTIGCRVMICNGMEHCGVHRCAVDGCKLSHMASTRFCGFHWMEKEEDYQYREWEKL